MNTRYFIGNEVGRGSSNKFAVGIRLKIWGEVGVVAFCMWTSTALAQQAAVTPAGLGGIGGTVLDVSGETVGGANVALERRDLDDRRTVRAEASGFFQFNGVKSGVPYRVLISAPGLKNWTSDEIVLAPGQFFLLTDITLTIAPVDVSIRVEPPDQIAVEQVKTAESQRVLGVIPNFYVSYEQTPVALSPKLKFQLAMRALTDPVTTLGFGLNAAFYQAARYPSYEEGAKGYGQRLGATFAGGYTNILVGDAVLPTLLHQDPRYFYQGTGTTKSRLLHALASPFVTRSDDGRREINYSNIGGDLASGAIANAYYPPGDRGAGLVGRSALLGAGGRMANAVLQGFLLRRWTSHRSP